MPTPPPAPPPFKLFATDLDGTLLDRNGGIHEVDRRAIAELQRRGVAITIVTGRMYSGTRDVARSLGLEGPVGCLDGSAIVAGGGGPPPPPPPPARAPPPPP